MAASHRTPSKKVVAAALPTTSPAPKATSAPPKPPFATARTIDLVIRNARVIDGSGNAAVFTDLAVDGGLILHVGSISSAQSSRRNIDAAGRVVSPGFIDAHSHARLAATNAAALSQGITTVCVGQDGHQADGVSARGLARKYDRKTSVNAVPLAGHATLRQRARIGLNTKPSKDQLERLSRLVAKEMQAGAFGLSTALEYTPGRFAQAPELAAIAKPVAKHDGIIMSHLRSEDDDRIDAAIDELIAQGSQSGARVHIAHIKVVYAKGKRRATQLVKRMDRARRRGVRITADIYPYLASYTGLAILFPAFARPPHKYRTVRRQQAQRLATALRQKVTLRGGPAATLFGTGRWRGKTLAEAAKKTGKPFEKLLMDLGPRGASAAYFVMDAQLQWQLLSWPHTMLSTDGGEHSRHPRGHGSFARALRIGTVDAGLRLEEVIRKMTGLAATTLGLDKLSPPRGTLRKGWAADLLIFHPNKVQDNATYLQPQRRSRGFEWVFVNGLASISQGKLTKKRNGRVLLRKSSLESKKAL